MADRNTKINGNQIKDATVTETELSSSIAGAGIAGGSGTALSVNTDGTSLEITVDTLNVKDAGITAAKLAAAVAGAGLTGGAGSALAIGSSATITVGANDISVTANSINATHIDETANYSFTGTVEVLAPVSGNQAANKAYVDGVASGLDVKASCRLCTTSNIVLGTGGLLTVDGVLLVVGDRVLVKGQTLPQENGIYVAAAGAWTRATDADSSVEVTPSMFTFVEEGTTNADNAFVLTTDGPIVLGTTALTFTQFSGAGQILAGAGLLKTGNVIDVRVLAAGAVEIVADELDVKDLGIDTARIANDAVDKSKINPDVAGLGLSQAVGGEMDVNVDASSIEINIDTLRVKALGITNAMLTGSIADSKMASDYIQTTEVDNSSIEFAVGTLNIKALGVVNTMIAESTIGESKLNVTNAPAAGQVLSSDGAGAFTWISGTADSITETDIVKGKLAPAIGGETALVSFSGSAAVVANSVQVFLNGLLQEEGVGNDYTVALATGIVTFLTALQAGDIVNMHGVLNN